MEDIDDNKDVHNAKLAPPKSPTKPSTPALAGKEKGHNQANVDAAEKGQELPPSDKTAVRSRGEAMKNGAKKGAGMVAKSGDFIGRMGTLIVMLVTTINTGTVTVTSFLEGIYWLGGVHAFLLLFIHLPVVGVMIYLMCKARMQSIYRKIRPMKQKDGTVIMTDVTDDVELEGVEVIPDKKSVEAEGRNKDSRLVNRANKMAERGQHVNQAFNAGM